MENPSRSELGSVIKKIPRPVVTMRVWIVAVGVSFIVVSIFSEKAVLQLIGVVVVMSVMLAIVRISDSVTVYEFGLESNGIRLRWNNVVAYRLSWRLGAQVIYLVEQATNRELPMLLQVFESGTFRDAVGNRIDLDSLIKIGLP